MQEFGMVPSAARGQISNLHRGQISNFYIGGKNRDLTPGAMEIRDLTPERRQSTGGARMMARTIWVVTLAAAVSVGAIAQPLDRLGVGLSAVEGQQPAVP